MQLEQTQALTPATAPAMVADATPEAHDDTLLGGVDTAALRNLIQARVFGGVIDPVRIGRFPILRRVGQGGMGVVYAAYDNELDRKVAIKLLRTGGHTDAAALRGRLLREAKALARLSDPGIVGVYEVGEHDEQIYVAMEFVEGCTLRQWSESHAGRTAETLALYLQAGRGLAVAHEAGIVHRDFKPDNAIVGRDGRVRVLDFGLATAPGATLGDDLASSLDGGDLEDAPGRLTLTGAVLGTPAYMAPEQFAGEPADARSDQFSFAVALFEALYGQRPFRGKDVAELVAAIASERITVPAGPKIPARILRALRRALQRDRAARFPDLRGLLAALDPRPARAVGWIAGAVIGVLGLGLAAQQLLATTRERERSSTLAAAAADLEVTAASERVRADDAELALQQRADALTMAEARFVLQRDPTRATALLANLDEHASQWQGEAWQLVGDAAAAGIADHVLTVPAGYAIEAIAGAQRVVLEDAETHRTSALWDPSSGAITSIALPGQRGFVDVGDDGTRLVIGSDDGIDLLEIASGTRRHLLTGWCIAPRFSVGARFVAVDCSDRERASSWLIDAAEGTPRQVADGRAGLLLHTTADGSAMLWTSVDDRYRHVDLVRGSGKPRLFGRSRMYTLGVSDDGGWVAAADTRAVELTRVPSGRVRRVELGAEPSAAAFTADGARVALATNDGEIVLIDLLDATAPVVALEGRQDGRITELMWSDDGRSIDSATKDGELAVWDVGAARVRARLRGLHGRVTMRRVDDGRLMAASADELRSWRIPGPQLVDRDVIAFDERDGVRALVRADGSIELGTLDGPLRTIGRHRDALWCTLAPGGTSVATRSASSVQLRDADGSLVLDEAAATTRAARPELSPDGRWLAWDHELGATVLELASAKRILVAPGLHGGITHFAFLDADMLVAFELRFEGQAAAIARMVDLETGRELPSLPQPVPMLFDAVATPAGDALLLGGYDGLSRWSPRTGELVQLAKWPGAAHALRVDPRGDRVVAAPLDGPTRMIDLDGGETRITGLGPQPGDHGPTKSITELSPRQSLLRDDGTVLEIEHGRLVAEHTAVPRDPVALRAWVASATDLHAATGELGASP